MQVRCLHCHEPTDIPEDSDLSTVVCSACGGGFSLVGDRTAPEAGDGTRRLGHFELLEWDARCRRLAELGGPALPPDS